MTIPKHYVSLRTFFCGAGLAAFLSVSGCQITSAVSDGKPALEEKLTREDILQLHRKALRNYNPIVKENPQSKDDKVTEPFTKLSFGLEQFLDEIYIIHKSHFFDDSVGAHALCSGRNICLPESYLDLTLYHEAAHVRQYALDCSGYIFSARWNAVAKIDYGELVVYPPASGEATAWKDGSRLPKFGCVVPYGAVDLDKTTYLDDTYEDVATFVEVLGYKKTPEEVLILIETFPKWASSFIEKYPFYFCDKSDKRYEQKLSLLREYNFLTLEEYNLLRSRLGVLRSLLQE